MAARFVAHVLEYLVARDAEDDFLEAARLAGAELDGLGVPALSPGIARVHVVKVAREQGGFITPGAGPDFHDQAGKILGRVNQQRIFQTDFQGFVPLAQADQFFLGVRAHLGVLLAFQQGLGLGDVRGELLEFEIRLDDLGERAMLARERSVAAHVGDHGRIAQQRFDFLKAGQFFFQRRPHTKKPVT